MLKETMVILIVSLDSFNSLVNIWNKELMDENLFAILSYGPIGEDWGK